jgi:hypothetical protein
MGRRTGWVAALACATSLALLSTMPFVGTSWGAGTELIEDGGFEAGAFAGIWTESSTNFDTPICDEPSCTNHGGSGALGGTNWALFGDIEANATETAMVAQDVVIQPGSQATLKFSLEIPKCSGSALDTFVTKVDDATVFAANGTDAACGSAIYQEKTIDLSAHDDGATHTLAFVGDFQSLLGGTAFSLDDVSLIVNRPPALASIGNKTAYEEQPISITVSAIDPDSDPLTYSASGLPPGASFDPATRRFSWTPSDTSAGTYDVTFIASDGEASDSEEITMTVNPTDPTTTTIATFKKTPRKVKVTGAVLPAHPGATVTVTLLRKRQGVFQPVRATTPLLDANSAFAAALRRTKAGLCRVDATFEGDLDSGASTATKPFRC